MSRPRLLDLFSGAGGAARGYRDAGFLVVGVDSRHQPRYSGHAFYRGDALDFVARHGHEFDAIHASPPCQGYRKKGSVDSRYAGTRGLNEPRLIAATREALAHVGAPFVIENVVAAREEMLSPAFLCGTMFGLPIPRHRLFETSFPLAVPTHPKCRGVARTWALSRGLDPRDVSVTGKGRHVGTSDTWRAVMGIDFHMTQHELREAIPPAYTRWIGKELLRSCFPHRSLS